MIFFIMTVYAIYRSNSVITNVSSMFPGKSQPNAIRFYAMS